MAVVLYALTPGSKVQLGQSHAVDVIIKRILDVGWVRMPMLIELLQFPCYLSALVNVYLWINSAT